MLVVAFKLISPTESGNGALSPATEIAVTRASPILTLPFPLMSPRSTILSVNEFDSSAPGLLICRTDCCATSRLGTAAVSSVASTNVVPIGTPSSRT